MQGSSEVFFRKVKFWDKGGRDAPPVFNVDGVNYLHVKVSQGLLARNCLKRSCPSSAPSRNVLTREDVSNSCWTALAYGLCMWLVLQHMS